MIRSGNDDVSMCLLVHINGSLTLNNKDHRNKMQMILNISFKVINLQVV